MKLRFFRLQFLVVFLLSVNFLSAQSVKPKLVVSRKSIERLESFTKVADSLEEKDILEKPYEIIAIEALKRYREIEPNFTISPSSVSLVSDVNALAAEKVKRDAAVKFPELDQKELKSQAEDLFPEFSEGQKVDVLFAQNPSRPQRIQGKIKSISATHVKIDLRSYLIADFADKAFRDGLSTTITSENRQKFIDRENLKTTRGRQRFADENYFTYLEEAISNNEKLFFLWNGQNWVKPESAFKAAIEKRITKVKQIVQERIRKEELRKKQEEIARQNELKEAARKAAEEKRLAEEAARKAAEVEALKAAGVADTERLTEVDETEAKRLADELQAKLDSEKKAKEDEEARIQQQIDAAKKAKVRFDKAEEARKAQESQDLMINVGGGLAFLLAIAFLMMNKNIREKVFKPKKKVDLDDVFGETATVSKASIEEEEPSQVEETAQTEEESSEIPEEEVKQAFGETKSNKTINFVRNANSTETDQETGLKPPGGGLKLSPPGAASSPNVSKKLVLTPPGGSSPKNAIKIDDDDDDDDDDDKDSLILNPNLKLGDSGKIQLKK